MDQVVSANDTTGLEIGIIGISGRFPGADSGAAFWQQLCDGVESIAFFSDAELERSTIEPELADHPDLVKAAGILDDVDRFDASFFGYTPREAEIMDPQFRLFLECSWEALEQAGYSSDTADATIGVYAGAGRSAYLLNNLYTNRALLRESGGMFQTLIGNTSDQLTTLVSYKLNLKGPSVGVQTACSTSLVAVHLACQSLLIGDCDMALAGGVSIGFPQKAGYLYQEGGIMSPDGHCRAFDAAAQGTVTGYGVGVVALKRLDRALADGDTIYAVIRGSAINNDGAAKAGYTAPGVDGQARVIQAAHTIAEVDPATISYIEAHGTGTALGDPIEVTALTEAFRVHTDRQGYCALGSVKTNIGHLDAAAGVAGLIKTALALHHRVLPPSLHFERPNPAIDFASTPFYVNNRLAPWPTDGQPRRAGVSSFGIGGTNAHAILEEAPPVAESGLSRPMQLLVLSAKTETALDAATANLADYLRQQPDANIADVAFTLQLGRKAFAHRRAVVCRDAADALRALESLDPQRVRSQHHSGAHRPIVFLFPGQGAQYVQMAAELYAHEPIVRREIDRCAELLRPHLGLDLRTILYPRAAESEAAEQIGQTWLTQPALFVIEYALAKLLMAWGIQPHALIGHSIGEYVAACLAGVFSLEDALLLVAARGRLIQSLPPGAMLVVPLSAQEVEALLDTNLSLAASNGPSVCVVSGPPDAVAALRERLTQQGVECRLAHTSHAFHSAMMEPILEPFVEQVRRVTLQPPQLPYISNLTGTWITAEQATDPRYWARHLRQPVRFAEGIRELSSVRHALLVEVGPGRTLTTLAKQSLDDGAHDVLATMRHPRDSESDQALLFETIGRLWLAGAPIDWAGMHSHERRRRVPLPTYPFERQRYWVEPQHTFAQPVSLDRQPNLADWLYVPVWQQAPLPNRVEQSSAARRWLIFLDACGVGEHLAQQLRQRGDSVTTVAVGPEFAQIGERAYAIHPRQPIDYQALFRALREQRQTPTTIVHLWSVTPAEAAPPSVDRLSAYQDQGFYSLLTLAQILGEQSSAEKIDLCVISNNIHDVTGDEDLIPAKATILGPCKVIPQEYAAIACRSIDIGDTEGKRWSLAALVDQLIAECSTPSPDDQVAYRHSHRWALRFERLRLPAAATPPAALRQHGVYLITGGTSEIGLALAEYLWQSVQARLVLVDRAPLPDQSQWSFWLETHDEADCVSRTLRRLQALEAAGAEILVCSADVASQERMAGVVAQARERFGALHGVIHTETVFGAGMIQLKAPDLAAAVLAPKVIGTYVLESVLADTPLDFMVLCSSTIALIGGFGQADYCAANAFVDAYAHAASGQSGRQTTAINWSVWAWDDGQDELIAGIPAMQQQLRQIRAAYGITPAQAIDAFARIMTQRLPQVIVSTQDFHEVMAQAGELTAANALEQMERLRQAAPAHERPASEVQYAPPRSEIEAIVATTLSRLLGIQQIGVHDNFFALGGNSLLAIQLVSALRAAFQVELHMNALFEAATVAELAAIIEAAQARQREREELEALLREIEGLSIDEAQTQLIAEMGLSQEGTADG
ncbi:MAG TPA: beta-ketoacyl synthase N-terminal-like domain-containing protein [Herpetosiphonaceae bacterium]